MQPQPTGPVPEETVRVAEAAFPKGSIYVQMRDVLGVVYHDGDFSELFAVRGRPAHAPWRLALVTVMQFAEGLSDRQAAQAGCARIDWKYALGLELTDAGFDFSVLSEFRTRLVEGRSGQGGATLHDVLGTDDLYEYLAKLPTRFIEDAIKRPHRSHRLRNRHRFPRRAAGVLHRSPRMTARARTL